LKLCSTASRRVITQAQTKRRKVTKETNKKEPYRVCSKGLSDVESITKVLHKKPPTLPSKLNIGQLLDVNSYTPRVPLEIDNNLTIKKASGSRVNDTQGPNDLYTPRYIKGIGSSKHGLCPICLFEKKMAWFNMKFSAYWYHLQFNHGVSSVTLRPFPIPLEIRIACVDDEYELPLIEAKCCECLKWVSIVGLKRTWVKVPEIFWWKHIASCQRKS